MTPEEIRARYGDDEPVVGEVRELRVSPNGLRVARVIPDQFVQDGRRWLAVYFLDFVGLTISLLTDEETMDWQTVWRDRPTTKD